MNDEYLQANASFLRLYTEYKKHGSLYIGVDFDGTIYDFHKKGDTHIRVITLIKDLQKIGCKIFIWTAQGDLSLVENYCHSVGIIYEGINTDAIPLSYDTRKPFYSVLLDDRAGLDAVYRDLSLLVVLVKQKEELVEEVADKIHQLWMEWAQTMLITEPYITEERRKRWERECMYSYSELSEPMKELDRKFAKEIIEIINK